MTNQEILVAIEEWVDNEEIHIWEEEIDEYIPVVNVPDLITFLKKLLHE